jgi:hypothetical protein
MKVLSVGLITGFMLGIEFPGPEQPNIYFVIDLGILRLVYEKIELVEEE